MTFPSPQLNALENLVEDCEYQLKVRPDDSGVSAALDNARVAYYAKLAQERVNSDLGVDAVSQVNKEGPITPKMYISAMQKNDDYATSQLMAHEAGTKMLENPTEIQSYINEIEDFARRKLDEAKQQQRLDI